MCLKYFCDYVVEKTPNLRVIFEILLTYIVHLYFSHKFDLFSFQKILGFHREK